MKYYFAPMEGLTGYVYRRAHHELFPHMDGYFTPFLSPTQNHRFPPKELTDVLPEHNEGLLVIPQLLTHSAEDFIWAAKELKAIGYGEVNLNLGCPSGTVTAKKKGSGFLAYPEELDAFLDGIFEGLKGEMQISVKTRLGVHDPEEFYRLVSIFNRYPLKELIIHPRVRTDFYKNTPNLGMFKEALSLSKNQVWYNGDLFTAEAAAEFAGAYPSVGHVMLGRGLAANPGLVEEAKGGRPLDKKHLKEFHDAVYHGYLAAISEERNVLFKMKELWSYIIWMFDCPDKTAKKLRKAKNRTEYEAAVAMLFSEAELSEKGGYGQQGLLS